MLENEVPLPQRIPGQIVTVKALSLNSLMPNTVALMASQHAVILPGANLFSMYLKMPGRKDARTSEKPVYMPPQTPFFKV